MADPICRWRNSSVKQLIEFNSIFPLIPTEKRQAREYVEKNWQLFGGSNFFTAPYQLAAQMGVYYENNAILHPRFNKLITINEAFEYMQYWGKKYYAPNPYTKSIQQEKSVVINNFLVNWAIDKGISASFSESLKAMFSSEIGNTDILVNMLNSFSEVNIENDIVSLKNVSTNRYADSDVWLDVNPNDKEAFYRYVCDDSQLYVHKDILDLSLEKLFAKYLNSLNLAESTTNRYLDLVPNNPSVVDILKNALNKNSLFEIDSISEATQLYQIVKEKDFNKKGNNLYSSGIKKYIEFQRSELPSGNVIKVDATSFDYQNDEKLLTLVDNFINKK